MPKIEIYTTTICPFCHAAKKLLKEKGASFSEISLTKEPHLRDRMVERASGGRTVPQIFIDNTHIGGVTISMRWTQKAVSTRCSVLKLTSPTSF